MLSVLSSSLPSTRVSFFQLVCISFCPYFLLLSNFSPSALHSILPFLPPFVLSSFILLLIPSDLPAFHLSFHTFFRPYFIPYLCPSFLLSFLPSGHADKADLT